MPLQEHRLRIQRLERQTQAEYNAAKEILENDHKPPRSVKPLGRSLPNPGPSVESLLERAQRSFRTLVEQHNGLEFSVKATASRLMELEQSMKELELDSTPDHEEHDYDQRVRQLENSQEKMVLKITEAEKIHNTYLQIRQHLRSEVRGMAQTLDQLQTSVALGQAELSRVAQMCQTAASAVEGTKAQLVQMERQLLAERRRMEEELSDRRVEREREVEGRLEREREGERRSSRGPQKMKEGRKSAREGLSEGTDSAPARAQQATPTPSTPQSMVRLVEDVDALREALSCTDLQELVTRLDSQRCSSEQLQAQMGQCEALVGQRTDALAALELQSARLKFSVGPGSDRFEQRKQDLHAEVERAEQRCSHWRSQLIRAQDVLHGAEQGVNNLYYRVMCVPPTKESPAEGCVDAMDKLRDIDARLSTLLGPDPQTDADSDQEKLWSFLEQSTMMEPRNQKRASSPVHDSAHEDTFQFRSLEEDCSLSREEIKRRSVQLMEAHQPKKKAQRSAKKT